MSKVSVCLTTYNRKNNVLFAIENILNQTYKNIQLIIVDDCSTDGSQKIISEKINEIDHIEVLFIRNPVNVGLASSRNKAINHSTGKFFTFCDDDDSWESNFIQEFVEISEKYNEDWCFTCCNSYLKNNKLKFRLSNYSDTLKNLIYKGFTPPVASQFYFISSLKKVNGYNEKIKSGVDHDLWIRLSSTGMKVLNIGLPLSYPNIKNDNGRMTKNKFKRINGINNALLEWRPQISELYGEDFYSFFKMNYQFYLHKTFFFQEVKKFDFSTALISLSKLKLYFIFLHIIKVIKKKIFPKKLYPNFFAYYKTPHEQFNKN